MILILTLPLGMIMILILTLPLAMIMILILTLKSSLLCAAKSSLLCFPGTFPTLEQFPTLRCEHVSHS
jgi:hypothetical protein